MVSGKVRLKFFKTGKLKFISHLDLLRTFKSALSRAGVPIWYTEGFNPHPKMTFSPPLPLGAESRCEYIDLRLTQECDPAKLKEALNAQLTKDMQITEVYEPSSSLSDIAFARYKVVFGTFIPEDDLKCALTGGLVIEKKTKKGIVSTDLSPKIVSFEICEENGVTALDILLGTGEDNFVNPEHLLKALRATVPQLCETGGHGFDYSLERVSVYLASGAVFA